MFTINCIEKTKTNKKEAGYGPLVLKKLFCSGLAYLDGICETCLTAQTKHATTRNGMRTLSKSSPPIKKGLNTDTRVRMLFGSKLLMLAWTEQKCVSFISTLSNSILAV